MAERPVSMIVVVEMVMVMVVLGRKRWTQRGRSVGRTDGRSLAKAREKTGNRRWRVEDRDGGGVVLPIQKQVVCVNRDGRYPLALVGVENWIERERERDVSCGCDSPCGVCVCVWLDWTQAQSSPKTTDRCVKCGWTAWLAAQAGEGACVRGACCVWVCVCVCVTGCVCLRNSI